MPRNSSLPRNLNAPSSFKKGAASIKHESIQSPDEENDDDNYEYDEEMNELMSEARQTQTGLGKFGSID